LDETAGIISSLQGYVEKFMAAAATKRASVLKESESKISNNQDSFSKHYVKTMKHIVEKGDGYLTKEIARLGRLLKDDTVQQANRDLFTVRKNILNLFLNNMGSKDGKQEL
jgi:hypothetical protein